MLFSQLVTRMFQTGLETCTSVCKKGEAGFFVSLAHDAPTNPGISLSTTGEIDGPLEEGAVLLLCRNGDGAPGVRVPPAVVLSDGHDRRRQPDS